MIVEIALGIILAFFVLALWPVIIVLGLGIAVVAAVLYWGFASPESLIAALLMVVINSVIVLAKECPGTLPPKLERFIGALLLPSPKLRRFAERFRFALVVMGVATILAVATALLYSGSLPPAYFIILVVCTVFAFAILVISKKLITLMRKRKEDHLQG